MAVTIINKMPYPFTLNSTDMVEGNAYMDEDGSIYICNPIGEIVAFSVCGEYVIFRDSDVKLREIDLTITVE